jgi:hypothetical protein
MAATLKRKRPTPPPGKRPTRAEILKGIGWKPIPVGLVPEKDRKAENRRMQDEIVSWTLALWDHIDQLDHPKKTVKGQKATARRKAVVKT